MIFSEEEFIAKSAIHLERFSKKNGVYNFRCPFCGDSAKSQFKARGNLYNKNGDWFFNCFNCSHSTNLYGFLNHVDPAIAKEYGFEKFKAAKQFTFTSRKVENEIVKPSVIKRTDSLKKCSQLHDHHSAVKYIRSRGHEKHLDRIYYASDAQEWLKPYTDTRIMNTSPKIVFPLCDKYGNEFGYNMRSIEYQKDGGRYQTVILDEGHTKCYGMETINNLQTQYVVEGVMDALSVDNAIAALDSALHTTAKKLGLSKERTVLVFDNEPRNKWIVRNMENAISDGWRVVFWPNHIISKDLNEIKVSGVDLDDVLSNVFSGIQAKLKLIDWKKV